MNRVSNLSEFLGKLDKISYASVDGKTLKGSVLGNSAEVTLDVKMSEGGVNNLPSLQAVFRVRMNGEHVASWGAESVEDNDQMVNWFLGTKYVVDQNEYKQKRQAQEIGQSIFSNL